MSENVGRIGPRTQRVLENIAERMIPSGSPDYPGAREMRLVEGVVELISPLPGAVTGLKVVAWCWEFSPFFALKFSRLSRMSPEAQVRYFESFEKSPMALRRFLLIGLKAIFMVRFYGDPVVLQKIGFNNVCLREPRGFEPAWKPEDGL